MPSLHTHKRKIEASCHDILACTEEPRSSQVVMTFLHTQKNKDQDKFSWHSCRQRKLRLGQVVMTSMHIHKKDQDKLSWHPCTYITKSRISCHDIAADREEQRSGQVVMTPLQTEKNKDQDKLSWHRCRQRRTKIRTICHGAWSMHLIKVNSKIDFRATSA